MNEKISKSELMKMWQRPPERQILVMQSKILDAFSSQNGRIAISWSGGKDSTYLLYKAAELWSTLSYWQKERQSLHVVFADTTNEHFLTRNFIKQFPLFLEQKFKIKVEVHVTRPKNGETFVTVAKREGLPLISKKISMNIRKLRNALQKANLTFTAVEKFTGQNRENVKRLLSLGLSKTGISILTGYSFPNDYFGIFRLPQKWYPLVPALHIRLSEKCCERLKKAPMKLAYEALGGYQPMTGEKAQDSKQREISYMAGGGCNQFRNHIGKSMPLGAMTEQTVLYGIDKDKVPISAYYGELQKVSDGQFFFSKECRGGCALCGFGIVHEPDRFVKLQKDEPSKVNIAFRPISEGGLGYLEACTFLNRECGCKIEIPQIKGH